jgi:hypothetical protein
MNPINKPPLRAKFRSINLRMPLLYYNRRRPRNNRLRSPNMRKSHTMRKKDKIIIEKPMKTCWKMNMQVQRKSIGKCNSNRIIVAIILINLRPLLTMGGTKRVRKKIYPQYGERDDDYK